MKHFTAAFLDAIRSDPESESILEGATPASVAKLNSELDDQLPSSYKEFISGINGGAIGSIRLFGIDRSDHLDLRAKMQELGAVIPPIAYKIMIPIASDRGGGLFCLDTYHPGEDGELPVWYWNHEYSEEPADAPYVWSRIYEGFAPFIREQLTTKMGG